MGNQASAIQKETKPSKFLGIMDSIASNYILNQTFTDLKQLERKEYCDKIVILTADVFNDNLNQRQIEYLNQRIKKGVEVNEKKTERLTYLEKDDLHKLDEQNSIRKHRMCVGIAKFYIKIAHLYSAIIMTLNPIYEYTDTNNMKQQVPFMKKKTIPKELRSSTTLKKVNLCSERINAILFNMITDASGNMATDSDNIEVSTTLCSLHKKPDGTTKKLLDEPGLFELKQLYYDVFDFKTNTYNTMSEESKKEYLNDVGEFYKAFTGNSSVPSTIKEFSDIQLKDYHNQESCTNKDSMLHKKLKGNIQDTLYQTLGKTLQQSVEKTNAFRNNFILILDEIFITRIDSVTKNKEITINPSLTTKTLHDLVKKTRKQIVSMYIECEKDFVESIQLYEAIIESQLKKSVEQKMKTIEAMTQTTLANSA